MATTIRFIGAADNAIRVAESAEDVARALDTSTPLANADGSGPVYVNAAAVACWHEPERERERADSGIVSSMSPL